MRVIIDRFEGNYAVCEKEDKTIINIENFKIPNKSAEGDVLDIIGNKITENTTETLKRKKSIEELTEHLWK